MGFGYAVREARGLLVWAALAGGVVAALAVLLSVVHPVQAQSAEECPEAESLEVPGAERQDAACLKDLTTEGLQTEPQMRTNRFDWEGLNSAGARNPRAETPIPGIQIDGYFPDDSSTNCNNTDKFGECHDSQFVIRFPDDWNGKLVITGAPGVRRQYALDYIISDYVLAKGYAFASTDKGNTGTRFYDDGSEPGGSVAEWHERVEELTRATKDVVKQRYGKSPKRTYITGISNGGYLTRYALENTPQLYDGGVDWEGTLFLAEGPNLFTYLPVALANYRECQAQAFTGPECERMIEAGFEPGSEFLWPEHYVTYWDLTQRVYREEFDPEYDGPLGENGTEPGIPGCNDETNTPGCDANYVYEDRLQEVEDAVEKVSLTGKIGKPMLTLHGPLDALLPIDTDSNVYAKMIKDAGKKKIHRYYTIEEGNHVDSYYDRYKQEPAEVRPILPCHRAAFEELEEWIEKGEKPTKSKFVKNPGGPEVENNCRLGKGATYSTTAN